jgi:tetratricopeptide (TPR) repeat protein
MIAAIVILVPIITADVRGGREHAVTRANRLIRDHRYEEAIGILLGVLEDHPGNEAAAEMITTCYLRTGRSEEAVVLLEKQLEKRPGSIVLVKNLGLSLLDAGRPREALDVWHGILGGEERYAAYYGVIAKLEWEAGMYDRAVETLKEGRDFPSHAEYYSREIMRLETLRGNHGAAFSAGLEWLAYDKRAGLRRARPVLESFREGGMSDDLLLEAGGAAAGEKGGSRLFTPLYMILLVEKDRYAEPYLYMESARHGVVSAAELFDFAMYLFKLRHKSGEMEFEDFLRESVAVYIELHAASPLAPRLLLETARHSAREAGAKGIRPEAVRHAVAMADSIISHPRGRPYVESALLIKARMQLEHLGDPGGALETLDGASFRGRDSKVEAERLSLEALLVSGRWDEAEKRFAELSGSPDTVLAATGKYAAGMVRFYRGDFETAAGALSEMAEEAPWSRWANDALETAVIVRRAQGENDGAISLFAAGMAAAAAGLYLEAADSLGALAERHPESALAARSLYEGAVLMERAGMRAEAKERLERVYREYPLSRSAPRAMEDLAVLLEVEDPRAAAGLYSLLLERYPGDPYATRVRQRYFRVMRSIEEGEA